MFTGLIQGLGKVVQSGKNFVFQTPDSWELVWRSGDSVAVNGCCLTVEPISSGRWSAFVSPATLKRTTLGSLKSGDFVNLEGALRAGDPMGGHWVQGHIDGVGSVVSFKTMDEAFWLEVRMPPDCLETMISRGSIALDGVSLTIASLKGSIAGIQIIPATATHTTLGQFSSGRKVNVETDVLGKYIVQALRRTAGQSPQSGLDIKSLKRRGF